MGRFSSNWSFSGPPDLGGDRRASNHRDRENTGDAGSRKEHIKRQAREARAQAAKKKQSEAAKRKESAKRASANKRNGPTKNFREW